MPSFIFFTAIFKTMTLLLSKMAHILLQFKQCKKYNHEEKRKGKILIINAL